MEFSVVIAVFNEEDIVKQSITELYAVLKENNLDFEIIIVNDGSNDSTPSIVNNLIRKIPNVRLISYKENRGKGHAIRKGILASNGKYTLYTDIDLAYPPELIVEFLKKIKQNEYDGLIGSRSMEGSSFVVTAEAFKTLYLRYCISQIFNFLVKTFLRLKVSDTQCGIKCFKTGIIKNIAQVQKIDGFCFDVEILAIAQKNKYDLHQMPVVVKHSVRNSKVRLFKHSFDMFKDILRIKRSELQGSYKLK